MKKITDEKIYRIKNWIENNIKNIIIAVFFIIFISISFYFPFYINNLFLKGSSTPNSAYDANAILSAWGSVLSFIGTVSLGVLALHQNNQLKKINQEQADENKRNTKRPFFIIENVKHLSQPEMLRQDNVFTPNPLHIAFKNKGNRWLGQGEIPDLLQKSFYGSIKLKNIGEGIAFNVRYNQKPLSGLTLTNNCMVDLKQTFEIPFGIDEVLYTTITYTNILGYEYKQNIRCTCGKIRNSQEYQIGVENITEQYYE